MRDMRYMWSAMDSGLGTPRIIQPVLFWVLRVLVRVRKSMARDDAFSLLLVLVVGVVVVVSDGCCVVLVLPSSAGGLRSAILVISC